MAKNHFINSDYESVVYNKQLLKTLTSFKTKKHSLNQQARY